MHNQTFSDLNSTSFTTDNLVFIGLMTIFFLVGVPGNIAVILFIVRLFKKNIFTVHLMLNLAAADILCLITLPVWIYDELNSIDQITCKFFSTLVYCSMYSSIITVTIMSVYRCLSIRHPQKWSRMGKNRERALLFTSWALSLILSSPGALEQEIIQRESKTVCERNLNSDERCIFAVLVTLLGFCLPFMIMITSYYHLHKKVAQGEFSHRQRSTKLVTRIVLVFMICWVPYHIIKLTQIFAIYFGPSQPVQYSFIDSASDIAGSITFINSCAHPFLYAFSAKSLLKQKHLAALGKQRTAIP